MELFMELSVSERLRNRVSLLEVLSGLVPGGGALAVKMRRLLRHVNIKPAPASKDPSKNHADVIAELRNVVGHGKRLDPAGEGLALVSRLV
jgi:hypothetical protein